MGEEQFAWTKDMREISVFGGGYEAACQRMVIAGFCWLRDNPHARPVILRVEGIIGVTKPANEDGVRFEAAVAAGAGGDPTGAMVQCAIAHALKAHEVGWPAYRKLMMEQRVVEGDGRRQR